MVIEFRSYAQRVFGGWVLFFLLDFLGFFFFFALLDVGKVGIRDDFMVFVGDKSGLKCV